MANWDVCYDWIMDDEDYFRKCENKPDPVPVKKSDSPEVAQAKKNARAISGINSFYFPSQFAAIAALPQDQRQQPVEDFYQQRFWNSWISQLISDELAKRNLDASVNQGGLEVKFLQEAINDLQPSSPITVDEKWGPHTLSAANSCDPSALVSAFKEKRLDGYKADVAAHPELAHLLGTAENPGPWWRRAMK